MHDVSIAFFLGLLCTHWGYWGKQGVVWLGGNICVTRPFVLKANFPSHTSELCKLAEAASATAMSLLTQTQRWFSIAALREQHLHGLVALFCK